MKGGNYVEVYIYFVLNDEVLIDELEDNIDELLGCNGEVTGSGMGIKGGNIDIEIYDKNFLDILVKELHSLKLPKDTYLVIDGKRKNLFQNN